MAVRSARPRAPARADDWDLNFDGLAKWFRVFAIDKLGQGYTDNPRTDDDYTMHAVVQHAYATLRALGIEGAHLVGHSRGGYLVCRLTVEHPELVKSCTIVDSNTCAPGTGRNDFVFANMPKPALSAESQRWVVEKYSYSGDHITDAWIDAMVAVAGQLKYAEAVRKMTADGFQWTKFLPGILTQKEEMFRILRTSRHPAPGHAGLGQRGSDRVVGTGDGPLPDPRRKRTAGPLAGLSPVRPLQLP